MHVAWFSNFKIAYFNPAFKNETKQKQKKNFDQVLDKESGIMI